MAAVIATGFGSIVANELGKLALDNMPLIKQVARDTTVNVIKKTVDYTLDKNPNFASFLGHFGFHGFNTMRPRSTFVKRATRREIDYKRFN